MEFLVLVAETNWGIYQKIIMPGNNLPRVEGTQWLGPGGLVSFSRHITATFRKLRLFIYKLAVTLILVN